VLQLVTTMHYRQVILVPKSRVPPSHRVPPATQLSCLVPEFAGSELLRKHTEKCLSTYNVLYFYGS